MLGNEGRLAFLVVPVHPSGIEISDDAVKIDPETHGYSSTI
jgi:hypothetical protein